MARASGAAFTPTVVVNWNGGTPVDAAWVTAWLTQVLQNIEWFAQTHDHSPEIANSGGLFLYRTTYGPADYTAYLGGAF